MINTKNTFGRPTNLLLTTLVGTLLRKKKTQNKQTIWLCNHNIA